VDKASERRGEPLPWIRGNDPMPGRSASRYARIPVEIAEDRSSPEPDPEPVNGVSEEATSIGITTSSQSPDEVVSRRRNPDSRDPRPIELRPRGFPHVPLSLAFAGLISLLGLFVASFALATVAATALLPVAGRFAAALVAAALLGMLAYPVIRSGLALSGLYPFRLESLEGLASVRSGTLEGLKARADLRALALASGRSEQFRAKEALEGYLVSHPVGDERDGRLWSGLGVSGASLERVRDELLRKGRPEIKDVMPVGDWFRALDDGFLRPLEMLAHARVEEHAWQCFKATAASAGGTLDALATLSSGSSMLEELGCILDLRMGRIGGAILLAHLLVDNDFAGRSDRPDADRNVVERADRDGAEMPEIDPAQGFRAILERHPVPSVKAELEALLGQGASAFGLRAESGLHHYFLMRRLGSQAIRLLRPLSRH
jgi:hypothetical protein